MLQFKLLKKIKNIKTWEVCRQKCQDEDKCDYWQFKVLVKYFCISTYSNFQFQDHRKERSRQCFLRSVDYKTKNGFTSGEKYCI